MKAKLPSKIVALASKEVGVTEIRGTNCGPRVNEYKAACVGLNPKIGWAWCAAFVCFLVREAMQGGTYTFKRPTTAGAWDFENWSKRQDNSTSTKRNPGTDIRAGDIVIFKFSHIGIAASDAYPETGNVDTIEGNTDAQGSREGGGVWMKTRKLSSIKTRIRFTV